MRTLSALSALLLAAALTAAQDDPLPGALRVLRAAESLDDEAVGYAAEKSDTYRAYEVLREHASREKLLALCEDSHPVVRCYALRALTERHAGVDLLAIVKRHAGDEQEVETFRGCLFGPEKVGDVMIDTVSDRLTGEQMVALAGALLARPGGLESRERLLRTLTFPADWHPRLRKLAEQGDDPALVALARYARAGDAPLIAARLQNGRPLPELALALQAAGIHRDASLLPPLVALAPAAHATLRAADPCRRDSYYRALAAQESAAAAKVLDTFVAPPGLDESRRRENSQVLFDALKAHRVEPFRALFWRLWIEHARLDGDVLAFLQGEEGAPVAAQAAEDLETRLDALDPEVVPALIDLLPRAQQVALIAKELARADSSSLGLFARRAGTLRDPALVEPLLRFFAASTNPHLYLAAAEALLAYRDPEIAARVKAAIARHEHLRAGWGGKALRELLAR